jgi:hypothetical protein
MYIIYFIDKRPFTVSFPEKGKNTKKDLESKKVDSRIVVVNDFAEFTIVGIL